MGWPVYTARHHRFRSRRSRKRPGVWQRRPGTEARTLAQSGGHTARVPCATFFSLVRHSSRSPCLWRGGSFTSFHWLAVHSGQGWPYVGAPIRYQFSSFPTVSNTGRASALRVAHSRKALHSVESFHSYGILVVAYWPRSMKQQLGCENDSDYTLAAAVCKASAVAEDGASIGNCGMHLMRGIYRKFNDRTFWGSAEGSLPGEDRFIMIGSALLATQ